MCSCPDVSAHMPRACVRAFECACYITEQKKRMELEKSLLEAQAPYTLSAMFDLEHGGACQPPHLSTSAGHVTPRTELPFDVHANFVKTQSAAGSAGAGGA